MSAARLAERTKPQDTEVQCWSYLSGGGTFPADTGQIMFATKQLTGTDLGFYRPPTKAANPA